MKTDISMDLPLHYRIKVSGSVNRNWFDYFDNMVLEREGESDKWPSTTLTGQVTDQAALMSMLTLLYDMQCPLLSVECLAQKN